uniref:Uncharacterized protein n=1 Tax=Rhizophora mucronata TaxID=61149 RepID=A0A2P2N7D3_RHIMU
MEFQSDLCWSVANSKEYICHSCTCIFSCSSFSPLL